VLSETKMLAASGNDDTPDALAAGLEQFLHERYLDAYLPAAAGWCDRNGAVLLDEVQENLEDLALDLDLKPLERKRLLGAPRRGAATPAAPAAPAPTEPAAAPKPAVHEQEPCPEPREADLPDLPVGTMPYGNYVKNTFIHYPTELPTMPLARGETCPGSLPGGFTLPSLQQAALQLTRLISQNSQLDAAEVLSRTNTHEPVVGVSNTQELSPMPEETAWMTPCETPRDLGFETVKPREKKPRGSVLKADKATVDVFDRRIGALIGKKGAHLRELEERTGATVTVPKEPRNRNAPKDAQVRTVVVAGPAAAVEKAVREIRACVAEDGERDGPRAKPRQTSTTIEIWEAQVKWLVGDQGKTVAAIEAMSNATISIPKHGWSRTVTIRGDAEACAEAEYLIETNMPWTREFYEVPGWKIGSLLGVRGETIRRIEGWSGATISVPREGDFRTVIICGDKEADVLKAAEEVEAVLASAKQPPKRGGR